MKNTKIWKNLQKISKLNIAKFNVMKNFAKKSEIEKIAKFYKNKKKICMKIKT